MKKLLLIPAFAILLGACSNDANSEEKTEGHEEGHSHEESHDHSSSLNMDFSYEEDDMSVLLDEGKEPYQADRVRFEIVHPEDKDATVWLNAENVDEGTYTADASELEPGSYEVVIHVNGPDELHEHTSENIEVE